MYTKLCGVTVHPSFQEGRHETRGVGRHDIQLDERSGPWYKGWLLEDSHEAGGEGGGGPGPQSQEDCSEETRRLTKGQRLRLRQQLHAECPRQGRVRTRIQLHSRVAPEPERGMAPRLHTRRQPRRRRTRRRRSRRRRSRTRSRCQSLLLKQGCSVSEHAAYSLP